MRPIREDAIVELADELLEDEEEGESENIEEDEENEHDCSDGGLLLLQLIWLLAAPAMLGLEMLVLALKFGEGSNFSLRLFSDEFVTAVVIIVGVSVVDVE